MGSYSGKYIAVGTLTIAYAAVLCLFWVSLLSTSWGELPAMWTAGEVLAGLLFASVPVMLAVAGGALCWSRVSARLRARAMAVTAVFLAAQATVACSWAFNQLPNFSDLLDVVFGVWALVACVAFVVVPSGVWAIVLAGTASLSSGGGFSDVPGGGTGNEQGPAPAGQPQPRRRFVRWGVLALPLVGLLSGFAVSYNGGLGARDMSGLDGTWREPANPKHSMRFRPGGGLESDWGGLSHGVIGIWSRHRQRIKIRHNRDWQHVDDLEGTLQNGTIEWQAIDRQSGSRYPVVWKRD